MSDPKPSCRHDDHAHGGDAPAYSATALDRAAALFRAMGDAPRLAILEMLARGERCVGEIVEARAEKFSTVSQRLRVLRTEGLIVRRRNGTHLIYALADRHVADLLHNALDHAAELEAAPPASHDEGD